MWPFLNPEQKFPPGFYRELYRFASKKRTEIAGCGIKTSNPAGEDILVNIAATGFTSSLKEKARLWRIPQYSYVGNKIYLRRALLENGLFFKEDTKFADMFWTPLVLKKVKKGSSSFRNLVYASAGAISRYGTREAVNGGIPAGTPVYAGIRFGK